MIEKIKRKLKVSNQDKQQPNNIQDLIRRYDLDNSDIMDYLDYLIDFLNENSPLTITNQNGTAIKFIDGTMICYGTRTFSSLACNTEVGSMYRSDVLDLGSYPVEFYATPNVTLQLSGGYLGFMGKLQNKSKSAVGSTYYMRPNSTTGASINVEFQAIGRWKN